ncbi:hypothetical protein EZS27_018508 [termite gut metagenome]|uniref:Uncharacterized protein n=1 Tax=termite gut metagenome TaxID=433724 RepID=A0A5J4RH74_9ZZZZ
MMLRKKDVPLKIKSPLKVIFGDFVTRLLPNKSKGWLFLFIISYLHTLLGLLGFF